MQKGKYKGNKGAPERGRNIFSEVQRGGYGFWTKIKTSVELLNKHTF